MGVTLYDSENYRNSAINDHAGLGFFRLGSYAENGSIDTTTDNWWRNEIGSIRMDPPNAYQWCGWQTEGDKGNGHTAAACYYEDIAKVSHFNDYAERTLKKMCNHHMHRWDGDCYNPNPNQDIVVGTCNRDTECWKHQRNECSIADIRTNGTCKNWCATYPDQCTVSIRNYCTDTAKTNIDQAVNDDLCTRNSEGSVTHSDRVKAERCKNDSNLFATNTCKGHCQANPIPCLESLQKYCANNMD